MVGNGVAWLDLGLFAAQERCFSGRRPLERQPGSAQSTTPMFHARKPTTEAFGIVNSLRSSGESRESQSNGISAGNVFLIVELILFFGFCWSRLSLSISFHVPFVTGFFLWVSALSCKKLLYIYDILVNHRISIAFLIVRYTLFDVS